MSELNPPAGKAILWDMDGVLVDTTLTHYHSWQRAFAEEGIDYSWERFLSFYGKNNEGTIIEEIGAGDPTRITAISRRKDSYFIEEVTADPGKYLFTGVRFWLGHFSSLGVRQAVASGTAQPVIEAIIAGAGIRPFFDALVSGAGLPSKPAPDVFLRAAEMLSVPPKCCLVIEDSPAGIEAARAAGMACLAVATNRPIPQLQAANLVVRGLEVLNPNDLEPFFPLV